MCEESRLQSASGSVLTVGRRAGGNAVFLMVCVLLALSGCGRSTIAESTTSTLVPLTAEERATIALPYFENFALNTAGGFDRMKALATRNSFARTYYQHQRYLAWAGGGSASAYEVRREGEVIKLCNRQTVFDNSCASYTKYSKFVLSDDRKTVTHFDVQDEPLNGRFGLYEQEYDCLVWNKSDCSGQGESLTLELLSVYLSANDELVLTYKSDRSSKLSYGNIRVKSVEIAKLDGTTVLSHGFSKEMPTRGKAKYGYASFKGMRSAFSMSSLGQQLDGKIVLRWTNSARTFSYEFKIYSRG